MRNWILAAGAAALAITAPALADPNKAAARRRRPEGPAGRRPGQGRARWRQGRRAPAASRDRQAKPDRAERQIAVRPDRGRDDSPRIAKSQGRGPRQGGPFGQGRGQVPSASRSMSTAMTASASSAAISTTASSPAAASSTAARRASTRATTAACLRARRRSCSARGCRTASRSAMVPLAMRNWYPRQRPVSLSLGRRLHLPRQPLEQPDRRADPAVRRRQLLRRSGDPWPQPYNFYNVPQQYQSF